MTKDIVKKGYEEAQETLKEKQIKEVKRIVLATLRKLEEKKEERKVLDKEIKVLKMDIDDLKEGRIDRITERQEVDEEAGEISVVKIVKIVEKEVLVPYYPHTYPYTPQLWTDPYRVTWFRNDVYCSDNSDTMEFQTISCSSAKHATIGTYNLSEGKIVNLR